MLHINARSLNKNIDEVLQLLADIQFTFSVISVIETWADEKTSVYYIYLTTMLTINLVLVLKVVVLLYSFMKNYNL